MSARKFSFSIFFLWLLLPHAASAEQGSLVGRWTTHKKDVIVRVIPCGDAMCGFIDWLRPDARQTDPQGRPLCQAQVISGFKPDKKIPGLWIGGTIYQAADDKRYNGQIRLQNPDKLALRGYLGLPFMGKTKMMTRVAENSYKPCSAKRH